MTILWHWNQQTGQKRYRLVGLLRRLLGPEKFLDFGDLGSVRLCQVFDEVWLELGQNVFAVYNEFLVGTHRQDEAMPIVEEVLADLIG